MFNSILTYFIHQRKSLKFIAGAVVAVILIATYVPIFASPPAEKQVRHEVTAHAEAYTADSQQTIPDTTVTGNTKVLILQEAGSYIEVRTEKKLAAYINSSDDGFEVHIASNPNELAAYVNATATPAPTVSPTPESVFTHQVTTDTPYYTSGPQQQQPANGVLAAGTKVRVLQWAGSYVQVRSEDGIEAFIAANSIAPLGSPVLPKQVEWKPAALKNPWQNYGAGFNPAGFFKDTQGVVHLRGLVKNSSSDANDTTIFILPPGYQPPNQELHFVISGEAVDQGAVGRVDIDPAGNVQFIYGAATLVSLDGITFRAK